MIFFNIPGDEVSADSAYGSNEGCRGGHYPVGNNDCWHSGIHINTDKGKDTVVKPIIGGQLIAYRINENYITIPLAKEISSNARSKLNGHTARLYADPNSDKKCVLKKDELTKEEESGLKEELTPDEFTKLPAGMKIFYEDRKLVTEIREMYELDNSTMKYVPVKKIATNFMLLKHECLLSSSTEEKITFYTLYMGLRPGVSNKLKKYLKIYIGDFINDENKPLFSKLPFYQEWRFTLVNSEIRHNYYEIKEKHIKIFTGSYCSFEISDDNDLSCRFDNADTEKIKIPKNKIRTASVLGETKYNPNRDRVPVFKIPPPNEPLFKVAELRKTGKDKHGNDADVFFWKTVKNHDDNYYAVGIAQGDVYDDITGIGKYTWWCKGVNAGQKGIIKYENPISALCKNSDTASCRQYYKIVDFFDFLNECPDGITNHRQIDSKNYLVEYNYEKIEIGLSPDKKIVSVRKKNDKGLYIKQIWIPRNPNPVVIIKDHSCRDIISFLYQDTSRTVNIDSYVPYLEGGDSGIRPRQNMFLKLSEIRRTGPISSKLSVIRLSPVPGDKLVAGEYIRLDAAIASDDRLPDAVLEHENLRPCCLACKDASGKEYYTVLARKTDLKEAEGRGILTEIDGRWTDGGKLTINNNVKGVILYDGKPENSNARDIILLNDNFEVTDPSSYKRDDFSCGVVYKDNSIKFARFNKCALRAGIFHKKEYEGNENKIEKKVRNIARDDILGYPNAHHRQSDKSFYDLACFFTDKSFLDKNIENEATKRYLIQPEAVLYSIANNTVNNKYGFFNRGTKFLCEKTGEGEERVYKLTVKSINAFILFEGMPKPDEWKEKCLRLKREDKNYALTKTDIELTQGIILWTKKLKLGTTETINTDDGVKWLEEKLGNIWRNLKEENFKFTGWAPGGNPGYEIEFPTTKGTNTYLGVILWVKPKNIDTVVKENGNDELEIIKNIDSLVYYEENPNTYEFKRLEGNGERPGSDDLLKPVSEKHDRNGAKYFGLQTPSGQTYYVPSDAGGKPVKLTETNLLDWKKYFIMEGSDTEVDLFCDKPEEILKALAGSDVRAKEVIDKDALFKGGITCEKFLKIYDNSTGRTYGPVVRALRKLICRHPLEWDTELYQRDNLKRKRLIPDVKFERLKKEIDLLDIWKSGGEQGIKGTVGNPAQNNFWFVHPVYFINHLNEAELLNENAEKLKRVQNRIVRLQRLKKGTEQGGMFGRGGVNDTYCNQAVFLTIQAVDKNYRNFIGYPDLYKDDIEPPWDLDKLEKGYFKDRHEGYLLKNTNIWFEILAEQATISGTGIYKLEDEEAQIMANFGYAVIAAWKNPEHGDSNPPHYATVRPDNAGYNPVNGPFLANVGANNDFYYANNEKAFGNDRFKAIEWYYNRNQEFQEKYDGIEALE